MCFCGKYDYLIWISERKRKKFVLSSVLCNLEGVMSKVVFIFARIDSYLFIQSIPADSIRFDKFIRFFASILVPRISIWFMLWHVCVCLRVRKYVVQYSPDSVLFVCSLSQNVLRLIGVWNLVTRGVSPQLFLVPMWTTQSRKPQDIRFTNNQRAINFLKFYLQIFG